VIKTGEAREGVTTCHFCGKISVVKDEKCRLLCKEHAGLTKSSSINTVPVKLKSVVEEDERSSMPSHSADS